MTNWNIYLNTYRPFLRAFIAWSFMMRSSRTDISIAFDEAHRFITYLEADIKNEVNK